MTAEALWHRYAAIWSLDASARESELTDCLADDATYCDPNGLIEGRALLSTYMAGFQQSLPNGHFEIRSVEAHHDRTLAHWVLRAPDDAVVQVGTSFALRAEDGRFRMITGFFLVSGSGPER